MADHAELVAELTLVEKMSTQDRLKHAKKRRNQQMKKFHHFEKQIDKENNKKNKKHQSNKKPQNKKQRTVKVVFDSNVMLLDAAARNDIEEVRNFLEQGVSPDVTNEDGLTALHQCCIDDSEGMMGLLIEFGANVNARDSELWTPLHAAATCGHIHLCKGLIDKGADLLAVNADGNMPYDICEDESTLDFIETEMAKRGVTQELIDEMRVAREKNMYTDLKLLLANNGDLEYRDKNGATPLHVASANGYITVVEMLLDNHVNVDLRDDDSWQPIHAAACWGQLVILEMLVQSGADLDAKTKNGETPSDICEEPELKQRIMDLKEEIENNRAIKSSELRHRRSQNTRRPSEHANWPASHSTASASVRRTSMRDKSALSWKEAREEAKMLQRPAAEDEDEEDNNANSTKTASQEAPASVESKPEPPPSLPEPTPPLPQVIEHTARPSNPPPKTERVPKANEVKHTTTSNKRVPSAHIEEVAISIDNKDASKAQAKTPDKGNDKPSVLERERIMNETNTCNSSDISSRESNHSGVPTQIAVPPRDPGPGIGIYTPPQGSLADLKKQRLAHLQSNIKKRDHHIISPNGNGTTNAVLPQNGHSPNLSGERSAPSTPTSVYFPPPPQGDPPKKVFTASQPSEIVGNEGKQSCCVIL